VTGRWPSTLVAFRKIRQMVNQGRMSGSPLAPGSALATSATSATEVRIGAIEPILSRRIEHIDVKRIFDGQRTMRQVGSWMPPSGVIHGVIRSTVGK
jgi:hypothetical protein